VSHAITERILNNKNMMQYNMKYNAGLQNDSNNTLGTWTYSEMKRSADHYVRDVIFRPRDRDCNM
jgi:hypothetical protein